MQIIYGTKVKQNDKKKTFVNYYSVYLPKENTAAQ